MAVHGSAPASNFSSRVERLFRDGSNATDNHNFGVRRLPQVRLLLLLGIRCYWLVWPRHRNQPCLFHETCSHHVYRITATRGFSAGMSAFRARFKTCRGGYFLTTVDGVAGVILRDGTFSRGEVMAAHLLELTVSNSLQEPAISVRFQPNIALPQRST